MNCELVFHKLVSTLLSDLSQYLLIFTSASFVISLGFTTFYKEVNDYDKTKIISFIKMDQEYSSNDLLQSTQGQTLVNEES